MSWPFELKATVRIEIPPFLSAGLVRGVALCTDSFTLIEVTYLVNCLTIKFGLNCSIFVRESEEEKGKVYYRIQIHKDSMVELRKIVGPYIHKYFNYKIYGKSKILVAGPSSKKFNI